MSVRSHRLALAGVIAAAAIALPTAALAAGPGTAPSKPAPPVSASGSPGASKTPAAISTQSAAAIKSAAAGSQQARSNSAMVAALATALGVSNSAAQSALNQLERLSRGGIDQSTPAFAAIAHNLGVSPAQLAAALRTAKQSLTR